jgi:hypothetical protein
MRIDNVLVRTAGPLLVNGIEDVITRPDLAVRDRWPAASRADAPPALGIDITFSREGRAGNRIIRMRAITENIVSTNNGAGSVQAAPQRHATTGLNPV